MVLPGIFRRGAVSFEGSVQLGEHTVVVFRPGFIGGGLEVVSGGFAADAAGDQSPVTQGHGAVRIPEDLLLDNGGVHVRRVVIAAEAEVPQAVVDNAACVFRDLLKQVGVASGDNVEALINEGLAQFVLVRHGVVAVLAAPVDQGHQNLGPLGPHFCYGGVDGGTVGLEKDGENPDFQSPLRGDDLGPVLADSGDSGGNQGAFRLVNAIRTKITNVVIGQAHHLDAALTEDPGKGRGAHEAEAIRLGLEPALPENALQISQGQVIVFKILAHFWLL